PNLVLLAFPAFGGTKQRQTVVPAPAAVTELCPMIVVLRLAADVDQAIDRGGAANHATARIDDRSAVRAGIGFGTVFPGQLVVVEHLVEARRDVDQRIVVLAAGLDQDDGGVRILGETGGQDTAGRSGPYDHVVCLHGFLPRCCR